MSNNDFQKIVGKNIRLLREFKNLTQGDIARSLKVDPSYISTLENGSRNPSLRTLEKIATALEVSPSSLLEKSKFENAPIQSAEIMPYAEGIIKKKRDEWKGRKWYHQRFDGAPYLIYMIGEAQITTRRDKRYDLFFNQNLCFFEEGKADWYIDIADIDRVTNAIIELSKKYPNLGKKLMKEYESFESLFYQKCEEIGNKNLYKLTNSELVQLHDSFLEVVLNRNSSSSMIDGFALGTDRMLEERIKEAYEKDKVISKAYRFTEVFCALTASSHSSFIRDAEMELFQLILKIRTQKDNKKKLIGEYRDKYFWMRNNYVDAVSLTTAYFEEEIARIESSGLDIEREIKRIRELPEQNKTEKSKILKDLRLDKETIFLLALTEDFTQWQDERKKATMFTAHYSTIILDEISRRVNIPTELLKYMSPREVSRIFIDTPSVLLLQDRKKKCVVYWGVEGHEILIGGQVDMIKEELLGKGTIDDIQDFRGMTASLGKAQGRVKILKSAKEIHLLKPGDVLVAVMTRPDYVSAMKIACAIVTDEGGITSHAAIVSREMKIPCVIGTKIATQVLKDGDIVEVNANHGLVKIIKKAG